MSARARARCFSPSGLTPNFPHFSSDPTDFLALPVSGIDFRDFAKEKKKRTLFYLSQKRI